MSLSDASVTIETPTNITFTNHLPPSSNNFSVQVSVDGSAFQPVVENVQANGVQTAVDVYLNAFIAAGAPLGASLKFKIATGVGIGSQFGFIVDLTSGLANGEDGVQATVSATTNLALGVGTGLLGAAIVGTSAPAIAGVIVGAGLYMGLNMAGAYATGNKNFNVGDYLYKALTDNGVHPGNIHNADKTSTQSLTINGDGSGLYTRANLDANGKPLQVKQTFYDQDGAKGQTTFVEYGSGGNIQNIFVEDVLKTQTYIFDNNAHAAPSGTNVGENQFYVSDEFKTWRSISDATGVPEADLRAANSGSQPGDVLPTGTTVNLPPKNNSYAPIINVNPNPTPQTHTPNTTDSQAQINNGQLVQTATASLSYNVSFLNSGQFLHTTIVGYTSGNFRPGASQFNYNPGLNTVLNSNNALLSNFLMPGALRPSFFDSFMSGFVIFLILCY